MREGSRRIYEFGPFRLDTTEHRLYRDGHAIHLEGKVYETLLALVEQSGHLMEKEVLHRRVWPDTFVADISLARNIHHLRSALEDEAAAPKYIETVPRLGYRFIAEIREVEPAQHELGFRVALSFAKK